MNLKEIISEFEIEAPFEVALWSTEPAGKCWHASRTFHDYLAEQGVDSEMVRIDHPSGVAHWFVRVGCTEIDWTARQFDPASPVPDVRPVL